MNLQLLFICIFKHGQGGIINEIIQELLFTSMLEIFQSISVYYGHNENSELKS